MVEFTIILVHTKKKKLVSMVLHIGTKICWHVCVTVLRSASIRYFFFLSLLFMKKNHSSEYMNFWCFFFPSSVFTSGVQSFVLILLPCSTTQHTYTNTSISARSSTTFASMYQYYEYNESREKERDMYMSMVCAQQHDLFLPSLDVSFTLF